MSGSPAAWLPGNPVALFQESVRRLAELPADTLVLPSHGEPFVGLRERVAELEVHHEERCRTIAGALGEPRSAAELLQVVFQRELDPLQLMLAMNEAVAHLEYMTDRGELERLAGDDGITRYVRRDASMTSGTSVLFEETTIRGMALANRFVRSATWEGLADPEGGATPELARLYAEFARGKVGLIISSHAFVSPEGRAGSQQLGVHDDSMIPGLRSVAAAVHEAGGKLALQIAHAGLWAPPGRRRRERQPRRPPRRRSRSAPPSGRPTSGPVGREMSLADIAAVTEAFAAAAGRAKAAGCDAVQIHARPWLPAERVPVAVLQQAGGRVRRQRRRPDPVGRRGDRGDTGRGRPRLSGAHQDELRGLRRRWAERGRHAGERRADGRGGGGRHRVERRDQPFRRSGAHPHQRRHPRRIARPTTKRPL